jgi:hypothetical protein
MSRPPVAALYTEGRIFGTDWSIANVAKLLRSNAGRGMWRNAGATGGSTAAINQYYIRTVSARHLPTGVSLIFMRLADENCWYASLCFAGGDGYLPWNADAAEQWLCALFGQDRPRVREQAIAISGEARNPSVRQFTLPMAPAV